MTLMSHILGGAAVIALACGGFVAPGMAQQQAPANQTAPAQSNQPGQYGTMQQSTGPNSAAPANRGPSVNPYTGETGIPSDTPEPSHPNNGMDKPNANSTIYPAGEPTPSPNPHQ